MNVCSVESSGIVVEFTYIATQKMSKSVALLNEVYSPNGMLKLPLLLLEAVNVMVLVSIIFIAIQSANEIRPRLVLTCAPNGMLFSYVLHWLLELDSNQYRTD